MGQTCTRHSWRPFAGKLHAVLCWAGQGRLGYACCAACWAGQGWANLSPACSSQHLPAPVTATNPLQERARRGGPGCIPKHAGAGAGSYPCSCPGSAGCAHAAGKLGGSRVCASWHGGRHGGATWRQRRHCGRRGCCDLGCAGEGPARGVSRNACMVCECAGGVHLCVLHLSPALL